MGVGVFSAYQNDLKLSFTLSSFSSQKIELCIFWDLLTHSKIDVYFHIDTGRVFSTRILVCLRARLNCVSHCFHYRQSNTFMHMCILQEELYLAICIVIPGAALLHNPRGLGGRSGMSGMCLWMVWRDFRLQKLSDTGLGDIWE